VCVIEKGAELGAHTMSGAVLDPRSLTELIPDWKERGAPVKTEVREDRFLFLKEGGAMKVPNALLPQCFQNHGNYIVRAGFLVKWLGEQAEAMGIDVYPGFAAADVLYDEEGRVLGVVTGDMGLQKDGTPGPNYQPGMELRARYTLFAEGCRGTWASGSNSASSCAKGAIRKPTASASRSCGRSIRPGTNRDW